MKFLLPLLLLFNYAFASAIDLNHRYAWSTNAGWFSFTNIQVNDSNLQGLAWSENLGWIQLDTITINNGQLSGYAWSTNAGWINFNQVSINLETGNFSGYAWSENVGWIDLSGIKTFVKSNNNKKSAIIIAASGAHKQNTLFPYSDELALRMYRTLFNRGYSHDDIIYMNPKTWQDLHESGRDANIIDHQLFQPQQELEQAFNAAANATQQFIFYIHGHAEKDNLKINREYWLPAQQLQQLLNKIPAEQIIIIDTCYSGSFLDDISGSNRTILTSSDAETVAWNNSNFSDTLIPALRRGNDINTAFLAAVAEIESEQVPQLDDDGDGIYSSGDGINAAKQYINQQGISQADAPEITQIHEYISLPAEQARAVLWIKTSPSGGEAIKKARATLIPPSLQNIEYQGESTDFGKTQLEMLYNPAQDRYETVYTNFRQRGEWKIKYQVQGNQGIWSDTATGIVQAADIKTPVTIQISFNKRNYQIGEQLRINITTNGIEQQQNYDLYLAILYPQGYYQTITYPFNLSAVNARQAYQSELNLSGEQSFSIPEYQIPTGWEKGQYFGCGVIMTAKGDPWQSINWISFDCKEFNLF
jgi:hypothetical protein